MSAPPTSETLPKPLPIGRQIARARSDRDFRQKDLADRAGTSSQHISRIERGVAQPSTEVLQACADALGTPLTVYPSKWNARPAGGEE